MLYRVRVRVRVIDSSANRVNEVRVSSGLASVRATGPNTLSRIAPEQVELSERKDN